MLSVDASLTGGSLLIPIKMTRTFGSTAGRSCPLPMRHASSSTMLPGMPSAAAPRGTTWAASGAGRQSPGPGRASRVVKRGDEQRGPRRTAELPAAPAQVQPPCPCPRRRAAQVPTATPASQPPCTHHQPWGDDCRPTQALTSLNRMLRLAVIESPYKTNSKGLPYSFASSMVRLLRFPDTLRRLLTRPSGAAHEGSGGGRRCGGGRDGERQQGECQERQAARTVHCVRRGFLHMWQTGDRADCAQHHRCAPLWRRQFSCGGGSGGGGGGAWTRTSGLRFERSDALAACPWRC